MLRATGTRSLLRNITKAPAARSSYSAASSKFRNATPLRQLNNQRPQLLPSLSRPTTTSLLYATKSEPPVNKIDKGAERKYAEQKLEAHPEQVSPDSTVRHVFEGSRKIKDEDEMMSGIRADIGTIKDTFGLAEVPKEPLYFGIAGVLPYAATSLSTVFLAYDINHAHSTGQGLLFSPETAHHLLDLIVPIQIGYGAVIISFLGAIHWGLEYAGYGGVHSYRRYMYGVIAPAVAWPTILMPVEYALITQFVAFIFQYFSDARATVRGWLPPWYSTYRFVLTFLAGASIVLSLIGRGQIVKSDIKSTTHGRYVDLSQDPELQALELEEKERRHAEANAEDEENGEDEPEESKDDNEEADKSEDKKESQKDSKDGSKGDEDKK